MNVVRIFNICTFLLSWSPRQDIAMFIFFGFYWFDLCR